jgi:hypothetical protein
MIVVFRRWYPECQVCVDQPGAQHTLQRHAERGVGRLVHHRSALRDQAPQLAHAALHRRMEACAHSAQQAGDLRTGRTVRSCQLRCGGALLSVERRCLTEQSSPRTPAASLGAGGASCINSSAIQPEAAGSGRAGREHRRLRIRFPLPTPLFRGVR